VPAALAAPNPRDKIARNPLCRVELPQRGSPPETKEYLEFASRCAAANVSRLGIGFALLVDLSLELPDG
jgi:hypothetical protein